MWHPNEGITPLSWDSSFEAQLLTMSGAIVTSSTRGITGLRQPKTRAPDAKSFQSLPITRITGPFQSVQEFTPYVPHTESVSSLYATERVQETWITSGRPYCNLAHRSKSTARLRKPRCVRSQKLEAPAMAMDCSKGIACFQTVSIVPVLVYLALRLLGLLWATLSQLEVFHSNHKPEGVVRSSA